MGRIDRPVEPGRPPVVRIPPSDAYFLMLYLADATHADILSGGETAPARRYDRHSVCLVDVTAGAAIELHSSLHALAFMLPRRLLGEIAASPSGAIPRLRCRRGEADHVIANLSQALLPMFDDPSRTSRTMFRHLAIAICAHLLHGFREASPQDDPPWLLTACRMMQGRPGDRTGIGTIAEAVGMTRPDFEAQFLALTGMTPAAWLGRTSIRKAMIRLRQSWKPVRDIARAAGFTSTRQFIEEFRRETGVTPETWRRAEFH